MKLNEKITIDALAPFDFDLTCQIFRNGDKQIRTYRGSIFTQVILLNSQPALVKITSGGSVELPKIEVDIFSNNPVTVKEERKVEDIVKFIFNLNLDLCSFYEIIKCDRVLSQIAKQLYGLRNPTTPTVFESLIDSIIEQQISIKVAIALEEKLIKKFGDTLEVEGEVWFGFPTPQTLAVASVDEIQQVGLSRRKAEYIHEAAELIVAGKLDLERLRNLEDADEIIRELDAVRGIGIWTAELTMLRGMQRLDALPADDLGIRRVISAYYCSSRTIKAAEAREIAEAWGAYKGLAAFYLIIAEVKGIKV